jgi:excisionase family DNA binding protein
MTSVDISSWGTINEVAQYLHCTTRTVRRLIANGDLPAYRLGDRMIRLDMRDVDGLLRRVPTQGGAA